MALVAVAHALDRVRTPTLALLSRSAWLRQVLRRRAARVELFAALGLFVALAASLAAPALLFLWAPLVLGVPHLLADVRYLALPRYCPAPLTWRDTFVVALLVATLVWPSPIVGGAAVLAAWGASPRASVRWSLVGAAAVVAFVAAWRAPVGASYVLVHAHNLVAVALFCCVFGRGRVRRWLPLTIAVVCALVLAGAVDPLLPGGALDNLAGYVLPLRALESWPAEVCARLAVLFVFLQSVHYAIWLRLVPEELRQRDGQRSFRASLAALRRDLGALPIALVALLTVAVLVYGLVDAQPARQAYLRLAGFHAYLELAFLARWASS